MAVPSPSSPGKSELRAEGLRRRRDFARSLTPELRAELEAELARLVLPHLVGAARRRRLSSAQGRDQPLSDPRPARPTASARLCPGSPDRDARMLWRDGAGDRAEPLGRAPARRRTPRRWRPTSSSSRWCSPTGTAPGSATARAITTARSRICATAGPVFAIGLGWEAQISDAPLPADPWDVPLDAIATPGNGSTAGESRRWRKPAGIFLILLLIAGLVRASSPASRTLIAALALAAEGLVLHRRGNRLDPAAEAAAALDGNGALQMRLPN